MWKNYLLTSIRSFKKEKFYVIINLLSLAMAFALCTIGYFNYQFNATYNHSFKDYDKIFKINARSNSIIKSKDVGITPVSLMEAMLAQKPELKIGRFESQRLALRLEDKLFTEGIGFVDASFLDMVQFDAEPISLSNREIVITDKLAFTLFDTKVCQGKIVELLFPNGAYKSFTIKKVIKEPVENTSFIFSILMPFENYLDSYDIDKTDWSQWTDGTFIKLEDNSTQAVELALNEFLTIQNKVNPDLVIESYQLDMIEDWAHKEDTILGRSFRGVLHPASVIGTMSSAFAILLLAGFNFFNTSIAISGRRLKEIGMRKVIGGQRRDIIIQFMAENGIQVVSAYLLSLLIAYTLIDPYNAMFNFELVQFQPSYLNSYILYSIVICVFTTVMAGAYPAFYISQFKSLDILKNTVKFKGNSMLTKMLLAIQFSICVYNIFALGVFVENSHYQEKFDRGYDVKSFINIPLNSPDQFCTLKNEIIKTAGFELVLGSDNLVGVSAGETSFEYEGVNHGVGKYGVGEQYLSGMGVEFTEGSDFLKGRKTNQDLILMNDMLNVQLGGNMLNKVLSINDKQFRVAGITEDFNLRSIMLSNKVKPTLFFHTPDSLYRYAVVKCNSLAIVSDNERIEQAWYQLFPNQLYAGFYQERVQDSVTTTNKIMVNINTFIAVISILISILGLYALISLTVQRRLKEIGIRKVLGASFGHMIKLLVREITRMMLVSIVIGLLGGTYIINMLMDIIYAYHVEIDVYNFIFPVLLLILAIAVSIGYKVITTAKMNPVTQLRTE
jgi:putative ABC transport system permease protein